MDRKTKGIHGEAMAQRHYVDQGYKILETNYRYSRSEIDFIALKDEKLLVFAEVKHRTRKDFGEPESFVSNHQQDRIKQAAEAYIFDINWQKDIRFDIVCVDGNDKMEVFEDAF